MGNTIQYNIEAGLAPFTVELIPSLIQPNIHDDIGVYEFNDVPEGDYSIIITDANDCGYTKDVSINPNNIIIPTTIAPDSYMLLGHTDNQNQIFDINWTNRNSGYVGFPDENVCELYLWIKTVGGQPIINNSGVFLTLEYSISSINAGSANVFTFLRLTDDIHAEVVDLSNTRRSGGTFGNILLKNGFTETCFIYRYVRDSILPNFEINITSTGTDVNTIVQPNWLSTNIPIADMGDYGIVFLDNKNIRLVY